METSSGKKYGLINMKPASKPKEAPPIKPIKNSVFTLDDDDDDEESAPPHQKKKPTSSGRINSSTLPLDDPQLASVYDYDGQYDNFAQREPAQHALSSGSSSLAGKTENPKSQYIQNLKVAAKIRERDREKAYERKLIKEQEAEGIVGDDQPKFITSAYKKKLLEDKKWDYADRLSEALEQKTDVHALGMEGFYAGLLKKNISMGGNVEKNALSAYTAGSVGQKHILPTSSSTEAAVRSDDADISPSKQKSQSEGHEGGDGEGLQRLDRQYQQQQDSSSRGVTVKKVVTYEVEEAKPIIAPVAKPEELISSARDRYLARKRSAAQLENQNQS
eukprot:gene4231-4648_t